MVFGASLTFAFAPFDHWWLAFLVLPISIFIIKISKHSGFKHGFCFALGYFGVGISWVHVSIADFGGLPLIGSIALMLLLCGYLALYPAVVFMLLKRYVKIQHWPIVLPLLWLIMEWLRARFLTGFPWLSIGYSQLEGPLNGLFPVVGEIGVSTILVCLSASLALGLVRKRIHYSIILCTVVLATSYSIQNIDWVTVDKTKNAKVTMVQGNIPQSLRWTPEQDIPTMQKYLTMTEEHWDSDLIIWPEAAIPKLEPIASEFIDLLDRRATSEHAALITGIVNYQFETERVYNNLIALGLDTKTQNTIPYRYMHSNRFAKHHLLPIGEFVPFESFLRGLAPIFDLPMSSFTRGDYQQHNLKVKGFNLTPAICFEIVFPAQIAANLYDDTDAIITVSNDAWFGDSHGPHQHLQIAQVRAREFGLPVFRATNNGVTAFVDHKGEISKIAPQFKDATLTNSVTFVEGKTPYRIYGDYPTWLFFVFLNLLLLLNNLRQSD
nr:apolipoprotein N-acyltransferase [Glaciecola sp. KUL10]